MAEYILFVHNTTTIFLLALKCCKNLAQIGMNAEVSPIIVMRCVTINNDQFLVWTKIIDKESCGIYAQ